MSKRVEDAVVLVLLCIYPDRIGTLVPAMSPGDFPGTLRERS